MAKKQGTVWRLYVNTGGGTPVYTAVDGEVSLDLDMNTTLIDTTNKGSSGWETHLKGNKNVVGTFSAHMEEGDSGNDQILNDFFNGTDVLCEIKTFNSEKITGTIGFSNVKMTAPHDGVVGMSGSFKFNGTATLGAA